MKQLVELGRNAEQFKTAGAEVIAVFREEQKEEEGLKAILKKTSTTYTLALDNEKKQTSRYSVAKGEFTGYVINTKGVITKVFQGDLKKRAKSDELLAALKAAAKSGTDEAASVPKKEAVNGDAEKETQMKAGSDSKESAPMKSDNKGSGKK